MRKGKWRDEDTNREQRLADLRNARTIREMTKDEERAADAVEMERRRKEDDNAQKR
jgi:hypothetical protein